MGDDTLNMDDILNMERLHLSAYAGCFISTDAYASGETLLLPHDATVEMEQA
jgi:hypothetical protein